MTVYNVGVLVGSMSEKSINRRLYRALSRLAPAVELNLTEIPIKDLPLYNHDVDVDFPEVGTALKEGIEGADAILIVTPEYNRSIPGALKNALDWASRPGAPTPSTASPPASLERRPVRSAPPSRNGTSAASSPSSTPPRWRNPRGTSRIAPA